MDVLKFLGEIVRALISYTFARLAERSTWLGLVALATGAGATLEPDQLEKIVVAGVAGAGLIATLFPDPVPKISAFAPLFLPALLGLTAFGLVGCVHFDETGYLLVADGHATETALTTATCAAHRDGQASLDAGDGDGFALKVPLGTGLAVARLADEHGHQAAVCDEMLRRAQGAGLNADAEDRALGAWGRMWTDGAAIVRGRW